MSESSTAQTIPAVSQGTADAAKSNLADGSQLSPLIRQLILSFGGAVNEQTWNAEAYARPYLRRI